MMNVNDIVDHVAAKAAVSTGNFAYLKIPAAELRDFCDSLFPGLAKNTIADVLSGGAHRWKAGHDLLIDVPETFVHHGPAEAVKQTGHILLTDFPTKAGIPIPGLSESGLGHWLTDVAGIPKGYLSVNIMDTAVGIFACTEGTLDLVNVCANNVRMTPALFVDTFVEGVGEVAAGVYWKNPLLLTAGAENILAGLTSTFYTITHPIWYVAFSKVLGCGLSGALTSLLISKFCLKKDNDMCVRNMIKACSISSLFSISTGFGVAALIGSVAAGYGEFLAKKDNESNQIMYRITKEDFLELVATSARNVPGLLRWWKQLEHQDNNIWNAVLTEFPPVKLPALEEPARIAF